MQVPSAWRSTRWLSQILSNSVLGLAMLRPRENPAAAGSGLGLLRLDFLRRGVLRVSGLLRLLGFFAGLWLAGLRLAGFGLGRVLRRGGGRDLGLELRRVELGGARHLVRTRA